MLGLGCLDVVFDSAYTFIPAAYSAPESNDSRARSLIAYLKKHESVIRKSGEDHYYRQVLWALIAIDFKTLSGPMKRELLSLLFNWIGGSLSEADALEIREALKKKGLGSELDEFFSPLRLAVLKEVDARDLPRDLRDALKKAFTRLQMDKAGLKRLEIFDKDEERFVNEMLVAGILPSTASPEALLGNNLITNLAGNLISGNFSSGDLVTQAKAVSQALGISEDTTGKLLQVAVNDKLVQKAIGSSKLQSVQDRLAAVRSGLESGAVSTRIEPSQNQKELQALFDKANIKPDLKVPAPTHRTPKLEERRKVPIKSSEPQGIRISSPSAPSTGPTTRAALATNSTVQPSSNALPTPKPPDPKIEAAMEIVDPRELLGGSFVYKNPKFSVTDPNLQEKRSQALGTHESKYFEEARQASIKAGPNVGSCNVFEIRSDKYCDQCGKDSKPCKCYEGMLKTVQEFELRGKKTSDAPDLVEERLKEAGMAVEKSVQLAFRVKAEALQNRTKDSKISEEDRRKAKEELRAIDYQEKQASPDRAFYVKKVLLNGVMNTKTPACILSKGRYGSGAKREPAMEPEWVFPGEKYCHKFDINADEPFELKTEKSDKGLSKQDAILLRLAMATLDGLEEAHKGGQMKVQKFEDLYSPTFPIGENQVCSSRQLCTLPKAPSRKDLYYRIFADESQDKNVRSLFDGETENTIARTLLRCFDPRSWGGMLVKMVEYLHSAADVCGSKSAVELGQTLAESGVLKAACSGAFHEVSEKVDEVTPEVEAAAYKSFGPKVFPFDSKGSPTPKEFCLAVNERYISLLDILGAATQLNRGEICAPNQVKLYERKTTGHK